MNSILLLLALCIAYVAGVVLYRRYLHPLSKYPGPFIWTVTRVPWSLATIRGKYPQEVLRLHEQYGPVVRIAPDELSFTSSQSRVDIFSRSAGQSLEPPPGALVKGPNGAWGVFNSPRDVHDRQRRLLNPAFSPKAITEQEPIIHAHVTDLINRLEGFATERGNGAPVDINKYISFSVFDMFGDFAFGESFECVKQDRYHDWISLLMEFPRVTNCKNAVDFYGPLRFALYPLVLSARLIARLSSHWQLSCAKVQQRLAEGEQSHRKDLVSYLLQEVKGRGMSTAELEVNAYLLIFAGAETVAANLGGGLLYLSRHPDKVVKARKELHAAFARSEDITTNGAKQLPYLNALLNEFFRIVSTGSNGFVRLVPPGGALIDGHRIPGGTLVTCPAFPQNRTTSNFTHPSSFLPERWLPRDNSIPTSLVSLSPTDPPALLSAQQGTQGRNHDPFAADIKDSLQAFGLGPRNCVGMTLAWAELYILLGRLLWEFHIKGVEGEKWLWEEQRTWNNWERRPVWVRLVADR